MKKIIRLTSSVLVMIIVFTSIPVVAMQNELGIEILHQEFTEYGRLSLEIARIGDSYFYFSDDGHQITAFDYNSTGDRVNFAIRDLTSDMLLYDTMVVDDVFGENNERRVLSAFDVFQELSMHLDYNAVLGNEARISDFFVETSDISQQFQFQPFSAGRVPFINNQVRSLGYNLDGLRDLGSLQQNGMRGHCWQERAEIQIINMAALRITTVMTQSIIMGLFGMGIGGILGAFAGFFIPVIIDGVLEYRAARNFEAPRSLVNVRIFRTVAVDGGNGTITNWAEQQTQYEITFGIHPSGAYNGETLARRSWQSQSRYWDTALNMIRQGINNWFSGYRP
ncbi:MAG: hypothetical protein FWE33_03020 [Defluviitaleaceae bacterium]|nr:hypothetical protein [Defluviitaleaceae bacterium]